MRYCLPVLAAINRPAALANPLIFLHSVIRFLDTLVSSFPFCTNWFR